MEKALSEISREEWVKFRWIEVAPVMGQDMGADPDERFFETTGKRAPDDAYQAMMEWDETAEARGLEAE